MSYGHAVLGESIELYKEAIEWGKYFTTTIWERGKKYQRDGFVDDLKKVGNKYTAVVYGSNRYRVTITIENGIVKRMGCNCPYAAEGKACKHMAAVCMEIDEFFSEEVRRFSNFYGEKT